MWILLLSAAAASAQAPDAAAVFSANCAGCHNATVKMGGFDMQARGAFAKVVRPGKSGESRLFQMLTGQVKPAMPMGGRPLAAAELDAVRRWIDVGAPPLTIRQPAAPVRSAAPRKTVKVGIHALAWRPDGELLALGGYREVRLVDRAGGAIGTLGGHADMVRALAFSPDGKRLAAAGGMPAQAGEVKIWDVESRTLLRTLPGHADCIYAVAFAPGGRIATSSYDKLVKLWDADSGREVRTLKDHIDAVYALSFTPDGKRLVSAAADRTVKVWDPATGQRLYTLSDSQDALSTAVISPDGGKVAAAGLDKTIRIWSLGERSGRLLDSLIAHEEGIVKLAWSPDGRLLASSAGDRSVKIFRASDLAELKSLSGQPDWVMSLAFSPDGSRLAAGRFDGSFELFDMKGSDVHLQ
jgi:WD40 repeat protein